jgi:signal recognition particle receptor subunit beta
MIQMINSLDKKSYKDFLQFKCVYWGPGESGKTTNFLRLREQYYSLRLTNGFSVETTDGRTLWQDIFFFSFKFTLKDIKYKVIIQITTCTGQERFLSTREYVLDGADGIIFVADSDPHKTEQNIRSFRELIAFAKRSNIPYNVQLNKRDLSNAVSVEEFKRQLGLSMEQKYSDGSHVVYETIAIRGVNVVECFEDLITHMIFSYFNHH